MNQLFVMRFKPQEVTINQPFVIRRIPSFRVPCGKRKEHTATPVHSHGFAISHPAFLASFAGSWLVNADLCSGNAVGRYDSLCCRNTRARTLVGSDPNFYVWDCCFRFRSGSFVCGLDSCSVASVHMYQKEVLCGGNECISQINTMGRRRVRFPTCYCV
jgi:hypothetical protein